MTIHNPREKWRYQPFISSGSYIDLEKGEYKTYHQVVIKCDTRAEAEKILNSLTQAAQEKEEAVKAERERCLKALPDEYIIHEYMPAENTPARRGWNDYRNAAILAITTPPKNISSDETTV